MKTRKGVARERRGSMSVLMVVVLLGTLALVAFVVDMSRMHTGYSELQTEADAASLRGAQWIQANSGANPIDSVRSFDLSSNWALGDSVSVRQGDVAGMRWRPDSSPNAVEVGWNVNTNAVRVRAGRFRPLLFGSLLLGDTASRTARASAIAWIANVQSMTCPAPWGFAMQGLNDALYSAQDTVVRSTMYSRLRSLLQDPGPLSITMIMYPSAEPQPTSPGESWPFRGINDQGNVNMNSYADQVANTSACAASSSVQISQTETFPGGGQGAVPQKTVSGAFGAGITGGESMCAPQPGGNGNGNGNGNGGQPRADCYPVGSYNVGSPGVVRNVSWIGAVVSNSANVLTLSGFMVMCVFKGQPNGNADPQERCAWYDSWRTSQYAPSGLPNSLRPGTIIGYPVPTSPGIGGAVLGNAPSLAQRLILVR